ncbi:plasmid transfer protein TraA [Kitasatospora sp. NPDC098663]|uniref:plasmid transfer protein TraA n=1 Tax=Kitasatospora sp. NPDC098663 TaxID=3364096 RepID=UPI00382B9DA1
MVNTTKNSTTGTGSAAGGSATVGNGFGMGGATFAPGFAAKFAPTLNVNVGGNGQQPQGGGAGGQQQGGGGGSHFLLGEPVFDSTDDVRAYCNTVRAAMTQMAIELAIAGKILEARLSQAAKMPGDHPGAGRLRARRVAGKLLRTADAMTSGAKNAVAAHAALQREYSNLIQPRPQRPATPFKF